VHFSIGDYIEDLAHNALEADSPITRIEVQENGNSLEVCVEDTGKGMTPEQLKSAQDPYGTDGIKHPGRKVGFGLPFLIQCVQAVQGDFHIQSKPGEGTRVWFRLPLDHVDTPPMGSLVETFRQILAYPGNHEIQIYRKRGKRSYSVFRSQLLEALGELDSAGSQNLLKQYLESQEESLSLE
jgi:hypothetical protein